VVDEATTAKRGAHRPDELAVLDRVLDTARADDFAGWSKHDALNAPWLEKVAGWSRWPRLVATQAVMRSPIDVRAILRVRKARNAKGVSLFARSLLARHRMSRDERDAKEARALLDWLVDHASTEFPGRAWGYPYPWQDVGFFAPRDFPNRVVTSFVGQALLDGYETLADSRYADAAADAVRFLLEAPKTLFEDDDRRCVSYVPDAAVTWIVMDVSALTGALAARLGRLRHDPSLVADGGRLVRYVVSKQTDEGAWFYAEPPSASHITHDNYHTGFILDAVLQYGLASGSDEFADAYERGLAFYRDRLFEPDGAPRFMSDQQYPYDIHGCAQGVITFTLGQTHAGHGGDFADRVLRWTIDNMWDPDSGWFYYQKRRRYRTKIRELRWCQGWMAWAIATHLEHGGSR
jgi:hypothetical protein